MNPRLNDAPTRPSAPARRVGGVMSAMYACAVAMLPPIAPASIREANSVATASPVPNSRSISPATPKTVHARTLPTSDSMMTGRRPRWSEMRPRTGAKRNCMSEYDAASRPMYTSLTPKLRT